MLNIEKYKEEVKVQGMFKTYAEHTGKSSDSYNEVVDWLSAEFEGPILTKEEKEYLTAVLKPFKYKDVFISKRHWRWEEENEDYEYLVIVFMDYPVGTLEFPLFEEDEMYKGLELYRRYSVEDLGIEL